jgi:hypothetical protein
MVGDMAESNGQLLRPALPRAASDAVPMIDANFVVMAYRALQAHGVDADAALAEAEIGHNVLADQDARIPFRLNVEMLEVAARRIGDACFGLHLGAAIDSKDLDQRRNLRRPHRGRPAGHRIPCPRPQRAALPPER